MLYNIKERLIDRIAGGDDLAKKIMLQGTASNVGKSIIAAGLCRIFYQDGYRTAPFKPQNMALNSYITDEGLEMGRAQVFQAEAAGIKPEARMNPILLKPCGNHTSQVIVNGKVIAQMHSSEYHTYKDTLIDILRNTFEGLEKGYDIIVMEGAGSCAEINLKEKDISNMGMADIADSPVILVSDIDRGGVFASIVGTLMLLEEHERARVKGVIINKFRGKKEYFESGVRMLEDIIKIPVLGVIPYSDIKIEDEDSVTTRFKRTFEKRDINIEIIRTPHMSNFTDFDIFETQPDVSLKYIDYGESIGNPDILIIPGSKSTVSDLKYIRENGFDEDIKRCTESGKLVIGICGGYQMLGRKLIDKKHVESELDEVDGLGLLDTVTEFDSEKRTVQTERNISDCLNGYFESVSGKKIKGYEIHMGRTYPCSDSEIPMFKESSGKESSDGERDRKVSMGYVNSTGNIAGTYIHGIFDEVEFTRALLNGIRMRKGLEPIESEVKSFRQFKEREYDRLADMLRENMDIGKIYEIMGL